MLYKNFIALALLAASPLVHASPLTARDNAFFAGFLSVLNNAGLTTMCKIYNDFSQTPQGPRLIETLRKQKLSVLVPTNEALGSDSPTFGGDDLFSLLNYVNIIGSVGTNKRAANPDHYTKPTTFGPQNLDKRWNNDNQVQVVNREQRNGETTYIVERTLSNATVVSNTKYKNLKILAVDSILSLPRKVDDVLCKPLVAEAPEGFPKLGQALYKTDLMDTVNNGPRITLFAPIDAGFQGLNDISTDQLRSVLKNHVLERRLYSPNFPTESTVTAISGNKLGFVYDGYTAYVQCGNSKAKVLRPDVITANGVVHVIDGVLKCD